MTGDVHVTNPIDSAGCRVYITEQFDDARLTRITWSVQKTNALSVRVYARQRARIDADTDIQATDDLDEMRVDHKVPDDHLDALLDALVQRYGDRSRGQTITASQFDQKRTTGGD